MVRPSESTSVLNLEVEALVSLSASSIRGWFVAEVLLDCFYYLAKMVFFEAAALRFLVVVSKVILLYVFVILMVIIGKSVYR